MLKRSHAQSVGACWLERLFSRVGCLTNIFAVSIAVEGLACHMKDCLRPLLSNGDVNLAINFT